LIEEWFPLSTKINKKAGWHYRISVLLCSEPDRLDLLLFYFVLIAIVPPPACELETTKHRKEQGSRNE